MKTNGKEKGSQKFLKALIILVGVVRLELTTTCTPCKYASQLRHTPGLLLNGTGGYRY